MPRAGLKPAIPATQRPQTYASDRVATGMGAQPTYVLLIWFHALREKNRTFWVYFIIHQLEHVEMLPYYCILHFLFSLLTRMSSLLF
jgi:hypothetical protein